MKVFGGLGEKRPYGEILIKLLRFAYDGEVREFLAERGITVDAATVEHCLIVVGLGAEYTSKSGEGGCFVLPSSRFNAL